MKRLLIDAKDLIELVERGTPIAAADFSRWLTDHDARVVLTYTNVTEFADCLRHIDDLLYVRSIIQVLESVPHVYLREVTIEVDEIALAIAAFDSESEPKLPDPYVPRWDQTFAIRGKSPPAEMIVDYRLDLMVFDIMKQPDRRRTAMPRAALKAIENDRAVPVAERIGPRESLTGALGRMITFWKLPSPSKDVRAFGKWVYGVPTRCPGFRLAWELFRAMVSNAEDVLALSDVWDNAHFPAIPYVDCVTLDRRMTGYCREVGRRLRKADVSIDYGEKTFRNLDDLMKAMS
ncbi:MAG: hypothetical protein WB973_21615 [Thermoanaerobaculia bacterium]